MIKGSGHKQCTVTDLQKKKIEELKKFWFNHVPGKKEVAYVPAKSEDFIFDRENLTITKKGQMKLL